MILLEQSTMSLGKEKTLIEIYRSGAGKETPNTYQEE
jgi:hypothetical protein